MNTPKYTELAKAFRDVIERLAANNYALDNMESYLSWHFGTWFEKYVTTPDSLIYELETFAGIDLPF